MGETSPWQASRTLALGLGPFGTGVLAQLRDGRLPLMRGRWLATVETLGIVDARTDAPSVLRLPTLRVRDVTALRAQGDDVARLLAGFDSVVVVGERGDPLRAVSGWIGALAREFDAFSSEVIHAETVPRLADPWVGFSVGVEDRCSAVNAAQDLATLPFPAPASCAASSHGWVALHSAGRSHCDLEQAARRARDALPRTAAPPRHVLAVFAVPGRTSIRPSGSVCFRPEIDSSEMAEADQVLAEAGGTAASTLVESRAGCRVSIIALLSKTDPRPEGQAR